MRLLLSICLLLASVVSARAQSLTWPAPGSPMHGEASLDGQLTTGAETPAERVKPSDRPLRLSAMLAWTITADDGKGPLVWLTGAPAPCGDQVRIAVDARADAGIRRDALRCDNRRAIRAFKRTLLPPDIA